MTQEARVRVLAGTILTLVFGAGVAVGVVVDRRVAHAVPDAGAEPVADRDGARAPNGWIIDRIEMTSEQRAQVDSVVDHFGQRMSDFQKDYGTRFWSVVDSTHQALRELLDEGQRAEYDSLEAEMKRRRGPGGHRGQP